MDAKLTNDANNDFKSAMQSIQEMFSNTNPADESTSTMERLAQALADSVSQMQASDAFSDLTQSILNSVCELSLRTTQNVDTIMSAIQLFAISLPDRPELESQDHVFSNRPESAKTPHQKFWNLISLISFLLAVYSAIAGMQSQDQLSAQNTALIEQGNEILDGQQETLKRQQDLIKTVKLLAENVELLCEQIEGFNNPSGCEDDPAQ